MEQSESLPPYPTGEGPASEGSERVFGENSRGAGTLSKDGFFSLRFWDAFPSPRKRRRAKEAGSERVRHAVGLSRVMATESIY